MQLNETEIKKVFDKGMVTRSLIETETSLKKCQMYSEMAKDGAVKGFFKDQAKGLEDVIKSFNQEMTDLQ